VTTRVIRLDEWAHPPAPARREVINAHVVDDVTGPPVLFVPGYGQGAWVYAEHWLEHTAARGFPAWAMSPRGHGRSAAAPDAGLTDYVHDVAQVAASLPKQAVLVGHGAGALVVAQALARYPARAGVLAAPVFGGLGISFGMFSRNPLGTLPGLVGGAVRLSRTQLFSREVPNAQAQLYTNKLGRVSGRAQRQLIFGRKPEPPVGDPPVLVIGSPDDHVVPAKALEDVAKRYGGAPLLFPGMGHELMLDARWREPLDALLDWLEKLPKAE
jgi:pimeloyl-ACP methyl ester carboxylesterase